MNKNLILLLIIGVALCANAQQIDTSNYNCEMLSSHMISDDIYNDKDEQIVFDRCGANIHYYNYLFYRNQENGRAMIDNYEKMSILNNNSIEEDTLVIYALFTITDYYHKMTLEEYDAYRNIVAENKQSAIKRFGNLNNIDVESMGAFRKRWSIEQQYKRFILRA